MKKLIILVFLFIYTQFSYAQENTLLNISENIKYYHTIQYNPNYNSSDTIYVIDTVYVEILPEVKEKPVRQETTWVINLGYNWGYGGRYPYYGWRYPYYSYWNSWYYAYYPYSYGYYVYYDYYYPFYGHYSYAYYHPYRINRYYSNYYGNRNHQYIRSFEQNYINNRSSVRKSLGKRKTSPRISRTQYENRNKVSNSNNITIQRRNPNTLQNRVNKTSNDRTVTRQKNQYNTNRYTNNSIRSTNRANTVQRRTLTNTQRRSYTPTRSSNTQRRSYTPTRFSSPSRSTRPSGNSSNSRSKTNRRH